MEGSKAWMVSFRQWEKLMANSTAMTVLCVNGALRTGISWVWICDINWGNKKTLNNQGLEISEVVVKRVSSQTRMQPYNGHQVHAD